MVRTSSGSPVLPRLTTEETSTGIRSPVACLISRAMPLISPCIRSSGAKCVSWYSLPPTVSRSVNRIRPTTASRSRPSHCSNVVLILAMVPSISVDR